MYYINNNGRFNKFYMPRRGFLNCIVKIIVTRFESNLTERFDVFLISVLI